MQPRTAAPRRRALCCARVAGPTRGAPVPPNGQGGSAGHGGMLAIRLQGTPIDE
eukprot:CAMPEP_0170303284 /NCGR_PEP_ID=MMETSP0116_2-20130129/51952_1 /TAXON_ID=400756 /ORGANISM="Durinskia baltica, Strain CSIRO CS-38" /LENGTH=53 /DNA_ID=CAMNT_0010555207 /DNA_START=55 /DNA_END=213 /DNA_ORIENTATION=-